MNAVIKNQTTPIPGSAATEPVVIVGTGPVGIRMLEEIATLLPGQPVVIYGDEPWEPYNRVRLSSLLAGEIRSGDVLIRSSSLCAGNVVTRYNCRVTKILRDEKAVMDGLGRKQHYSKLILATGSRPFVPAVPGRELPGVFTFRDIADTEKLVARRMRSNRTVILGGGLLGLECARAMQRFNTRVTVIEHNVRLLFRQLDDGCAALLQENVQALGMEIVLQDSVRMIIGSNTVHGVLLRSGREIECDTFIISAGIVPNTELARAAGILCHRGVLVGDTMQTSDPDVYAVGECCEHDGEVYGIVAPGYEQAGIAARNIAGRSASYRGSVQATSLKVVGFPLFSMGDVDDSVRTITPHVYRDERCYRRLNVYRGRITGIVALGEWPELIKLREAAKRGRYLFPWRYRRFKRCGNLWPESKGYQVASWPETATVCTCNAVSRGQLSKALASGCDSVAALTSQTGAATVCGSCKPLLADLLGHKEIDPVKGHRPLLITALAALLLTLLAYFAPSIPYTGTVQLPWRWDLLWTTSLYKQISGFTLLGLSALILILSLRKRIEAFRWGHFDFWRLAHVIIGGLTLAALAVHTGFRLGSNLNFLLMLSFLSMVFIGAIISTLIAVEHKLEGTWAKQVRSMGLWAHIVLFWPIPVLLGLHIFKTYYF